MSIGIFLVVLISLAFSLAPTSSSTKEKRLEIDEVRTETGEAVLLAVELVLILGCAGSSFRCVKTSMETKSWHKLGLGHWDPRKPLTYILVL